MFSGFGEVSGDHLEHVCDILECEGCWGCAVAIEQLVDAGFGFERGVVGFGGEGHGQLFLDAAALLAV